MNEKVKNVKANKFGGFLHLKKRDKYLHIKNYRIESHIKMD